MGDQLSLIPFGLGLMLIIQSVVKGRQAHYGPLELVAGAVRQSWFVFFWLGILLPRDTVGARSALIAGSLLVVWGLWHDVREYRRRIGS
jgi:hypothetical protein